MSDTTTLKLPPRLKTRIARLARQTGRTAHAVMLEALEREMSRQERMCEFLREAARGREYENGKLELR